MEKKERARLKTVKFNAKSRDRGVSDGVDGPWSQKRVLVPVTRLYLHTKTFFCSLYLSCKIFFIAFIVCLISASLKMLSFPDST